MRNERRPSEAMSDRELLVDIRDAVYGDNSDDKPGLKLRVDRLEQRAKLAIWIASIVAAAVVVEEVARAYRH